MRTTKLGFATLFSLLLGVAHAGPPPTPEATAAYVEELLDVQRVGRDGPGVTILVARGDTVLYKGARGMASIELGVPMQPDQIMRIGSVTKQFAAATLLKQIEEGKARLDDPLSKFLPDYPNGSKITLAQLLNHTSGVKSYTSISGYMGNPVRRDLTTAELIKEFKDLPVDFAPGEKWAYNNSGYVLVGAVIEAISGKSWHQTLEDTVLRPAGINWIQYQASDLLFKGMAQGYSVNSRKAVIPAGLLSMTQPHAAGALIANAESLWRWNQALHGGKVLSPASYARMTTSEGPAKPFHYGYGIFNTPLRGQSLLTHGGGINGFTSVLHYIPQTQTTVVILRNSDSGNFPMDIVSRRIVAFANGEPLEEPQVLEVSADSMRSAAGVYTREDKRQCTLRMKAGELHSQCSGAKLNRLIPIAADRYIVVDSVTQLQIDRDEQGRATGVRVFGNGEGVTERWTRNAASSR